MDNERLKELFDHGGTLVIFGMPPRTEFGIDMHTWQVGDKFKGIKMIPPGLHFIYFSATNKDGQIAPRTGFFHYFKKGEILVKNYSEANEDLTDENNLEQISRVKQNLRGLDGNLGPYPFDSWSKWVSFTQHIREEDLLRLQPLSGKISSVPELINKQKWKQSESNKSEESSSKSIEDTNDETDPEPCSSSSMSELPDLSKLPDMEPIPGTELRFSRFPDRPHDEGASPMEITRGNMDSSFSLQIIVDQFQKPENVLAEVQFAFTCFLVGQVWDSWEHWRKLVTALCKAEQFLVKYPDLYSQFLSVLHYEIEAVPQDFFADIVESNNFLVVSLTFLFANIEDNKSVLPREFIKKSRTFKQHLTSRFLWNLTLVEEGEDAPVIVDFT